MNEDDDPYTFSELSYIPLFDTNIKKDDTTLFARSAIREETPQIVFHCTNNDPRLTFYIDISKSLPRAKWIHEPANELALTAFDVSGRFLNVPLECLSQQMFQQTLHTIYALCQMDKTVDVETYDAIPNGAIVLVYDINSEKSIDWILKWTAHKSPLLYTSSSSTDFGKQTNRNAPCLVKVKDRVGRLIDKNYDIDAFLTRFSRRSLVEY